MYNIELDNPVKGCSSSRLGGPFRSHLDFPHNILVPNYLR